MLTGQLALTAAAALRRSRLLRERRRAAAGSRWTTALCLPSGSRAIIGAPDAGQPCAGRGMLGLATWWLSGDWRWIVGALLILAPWP